MSEFLYWLMVICRLVKALFPFLVAGVLLLFAFKELGPPPAPVAMGIGLFFIVWIGIHVKALSGSIFKRPPDRRNYRK